MAVFGVEAPSMTINARKRPTEVRMNVAHARDASTPAPIASVIPLRRSVPCASGIIFAIGVEIHLAGSVGRAALALHELHALAEAELCETGDPMLALVGAADELIERLSNEQFDDVSIALGVALSPVGRAVLRVRPENVETTVLVHRNELRLALSTASRGEGSPVATVARPSASASLRSARLALNAPSTARVDDEDGHDGHDAPDSDAFVIETDGTLHQYVM